MKLGETSIRQLGINTDLQAIFLTSVGFEELKCMPISEEGEGFEKS